MIKKTVINGVPVQFSLDKVPFYTAEKAAEEVIAEYKTGKTYFHLDGVDYSVVETIEGGYHIMCSSN